MRRMVFTLLAALCLLIGAGQMAWAQIADEIIGIQWQWAQLTETEPASPPFHGCLLHGNRQPDQQPSVRQCRKPQGLRNSQLATRNRELLED